MTRDKNGKSPSIFYFAFLFFLPLFGLSLRLSNAQEMEWIRATDSAGWSGREGHTSVAFDNKIWVLGGMAIDGIKNDVWYSTDGINWVQATDSAGWPRRGGLASVVFDNKIWVLGGYGGGGRFLSDVWYSTGLYGLEEDRNLFNSNIPTLEIIHPNPTINHIEIVYNLPKRTKVKISLYNSNGREVKVLESGIQEKGFIKSPGIKEIMWTCVPLCVRAEFFHQASIFLDYL